MVNHSHFDTQNELKPRHCIKLFVILAFFAIRKNNTDDFIVEQSSGLEKKNLDAITGKKLLNDTKLMVREKLLLLILQLLLLLLLLNNIIDSPLNNSLDSWLAV